MEISHGTPVFLQEIVTNPEEWIGKEIRVVGSLIYHNIESEVGVLQQYLERKENFLVVDTNLVERSHNWNMVELIGTLVFDHTPGTGMTSKYNQIPQNIRSRLTDGTAKTMIPVLVARIIRDVQGMNMSLYQQVITLRRDFDHKFNEIMDNIEVKEMTIE